MKRSTIIYLLVLIVTSFNANSQDNKLSIDNVLSIVRKYHPVVKQASIQNKIAENQLTSAKSVFDPTIQINSQEKTFDKKLYYRYNNSEIKK